jgi:hypothetical protein
MTLIAIISACGAAAGACPSIGGGTVESYPEDMADRSVSGSFLHNATVSLFERHGFERTRRLGKNRRVVARDAPAPRLAHRP